MRAKVKAERQAASPWAYYLTLLVFTLGVLVAMGAHVYAQQTTTSSEQVWQALKGDVFGDRSILADDGVVRIEAPKRAQDAAIVPVDIYLDPAKAPEGVKTVTMIIDVNPAPVAARFDLGKEAGITHISTRVRVNDYSFIRAIAETADGKLHMSQTFVKASGGCSAPAVKNSKEALASMGQMKLRQFEGTEKISKAEEIQLMIRHPNNSGLQRDPLTQYFIPAHFVDKMTISQGDRLILAMEGGISISEDPNFRFDFNAQGKEDLKVVASDTEGKRFESEWPLTSPVSN